MMRATAASVHVRSASVGSPLAEHHMVDRCTRADALVEGLVLHSALSTDPMDATQIRSALHRLAG